MSNPMPRYSLMAQALRETLKELTGRRFKVTHDQGGAVGPDTPFADFTPPAPGYVFRCLVQRDGRAFYVAHFLEDAVYPPEQWEHLQPAWALGVAMKVRDHMHKERV